MIRQDFYTGEPVEMGSPNFSSELEAANMASFGKYDYDSNSRVMMQQAQPQPQYYQPYPNMVGIGAPYYQGQQYSPYGNLQPLTRPFGQQFQQFQQPQPQTYHIPGFNPGGSEFLPPADYEDIIEDLQLDYWNARMEVDVKTEMDMQQSVYGNNTWGYNYYGMPYYNPYKYNSVDNEFSQKINKIKDDARNNRINLNIQLSKLCHNILDDGVTEEEIIQRCTGMDLPAPQISWQANQDYYTEMRIANMVPFNNASYYSNARAAHQRELDKILPPDANMEETFKNLGVLAVQYEWEEEAHRRKDLSGSYSSGGNMYKYYVKRKAQERYAAEHGMPVGNTNQFNTTFGNQILNGLPTLSQNATVADDGTLNVSLSLPVNVGSHRGEMYTVTNQNEAEYEKKREQFGKFLNSIKSDIYLDDLKKKKFESSTFI